jgi:DNA-binding Xre family transcriptional regulator
MKWNLRLTAANRGVWKASDLQRMLAEHGLVISAGKMSGLWSGQPASIKLEDLDVICTVLGCQIGEVLIPEPDKVTETDQNRGRSTFRAPGDPPEPPSADPSGTDYAPGRLRRTGCQGHHGRDYGCGEQR